MIGWKRVPIVLLVATLMGTAQPVLASTFSEAQSLFTLGNYRAAAVAAAAVATPQSLALASRAHLVRAAYLLPLDRAKAELDEAEALARQSLDMQPDQSAAALNLAIILGYRTRIDGYVDSFFAGRAEEAKRLISKAEEVDPQSAWAHLVEGGWNAEIVVGAGAGLANTIYGATRDKAVTAFEQAVKLDQYNPTIRLEYAKALIKLYGEKAWPTAEGHLKIALSFEPTEELTKIVQGRAQQLLDAINGGDAAVVKTRLQEIDPFSGH